MPACICLEAARAADEYALSSVLQLTMPEPGAGGAAAPRPAPQVVCRAVIFCSHLHVQQKTVVSTLVVGLGVDKCSSYPCFHLSRFPLPSLSLVQAAAALPPAAPSQPAAMAAPQEPTDVPAPAPPVAEAPLAAGARPAGALSAPPSAQVGYLVKRPVLAC